VKGGPAYGGRRNYCNLLCGAVAQVICGWNEEGRKVRKGEFLECAGSHVHRRRGEKNFRGEIWQMLEKGGGREWVDAGTGGDEGGPTVVGSAKFEPP